MIARCTKRNHELVVDSAFRTRGVEGVPDSKPVLDGEIRGGD